MAKQESHRIWIHILAMVNMPPPTNHIAAFVNTTFTVILFPYPLYLQHQLMVQTRFWFYLKTMVTPQSHGCIIPCKTGASLLDPMIAPQRNVTRLLV